MFKLSDIQRGLFLPFFLTLLFLPLSGCDKPDVAPADKFVVGIININSGVKPVIEGFKEKLTELSERDDRVLEIIEPPVFTDLDVDKALLTLKDRGVDLVLTAATSPTTKASKVFEDTDTTVIFAPIYDPVRSGVIEGLEKASEQITGVKVGGSNYKSLAFLKQAKPDLKKILVPWSGMCMVEGFSLTDLQAAAAKLDIKLVVAKIQSVNELRHKLDSLSEDIDAVWLLHSTFLVPNYQLFVDATIKNKILLASGTGLGSKGVMISYGPDFKQTGYKAAHLANQIAKGHSVKELPVIESEFFLTINMDSVNSAAIELPLEFIHQADFILKE